jgi:very-short-patch-repair endonuclease
MLTLYIVGIVIAGAVAFAVLGTGVRGVKEKARYQYTRKSFFLTRAEHECYDALVAAVGSDYFIFAQVHLPTIVDNKVKGQHWRGAFRHISEKSVDFVLCDKVYISPKLAIELDDKTHARPERQERDREVERILQGAGVLLRFENRGRFSVSELAQKVANVLR